MNAHRLTLAVIAAAAVALTGACSGGGDTNSAAPTTIDAGGFDCAGVDIATTGPVETIETFRSVADTTSDTKVADAATTSADALDTVVEKNPGMVNMTAENFAELDPAEAERYQAAAAAFQAEHGASLEIVWAYLEEICGVDAGN